MICLWNTHREQWCQPIPFSLKKERVTFWHHSPIQGTESSPSELRSDSQSTCSSGWDAVPQMPYLLHSFSASSRPCVYVCTKNTPGKNIIPSYWITPALYSHSWTSWHTVNSAEIVSGQSASPAALTFHHELHSHCSRDWKRVSRLFPCFSALSDHLG